MPAIDLTRLRKQATRLADFFFLPDEFMKHLREILEFYVNYTLRTVENVAPGSNLKTYRTPPAVLTQIQNELRLKAEENPHFALELADLLWDEGALETRLLAAYLLGRIPPQEERLLPASPHGRNRSATRKCAWRYSLQVSHVCAKKHLINFLHSCASICTPNDLAPGRTAFKR